MKPEEKKEAVLNMLKDATKEFPVTISDIFLTIQCMSRWNVGNYVKILQSEYPENIKSTKPVSGISTKFYWVETEESETSKEKEKEEMTADTRTEKEGYNIEGYRDSTAEAAMKSLIKHAQDNECKETVIIDGNIYYTLNHSYKVLVVGVLEKSLLVLYVNTNMANMEKPFKLFNKTGKVYYVDMVSITRIGKLIVRDRICAVNSASMDELRKRMTNLIGYHPTPQTVEKEVIKTVPGTKRDNEKIIKLEAQVDILQNIVKTVLLGASTTARFTAEELSNFMKTFNK